MASKYIDWDELLLTADPKKKEIEVSFKKIDGSGVLFKGTEPGTGGGTTEDPKDDGACKNEVMIVSDDTFLLEDNAEHNIWIVLRSAPIEYMEIDLLFTDGTIEYPDYQYQAVTVQLWPENFRINGNGPDYVSYLLLKLGDIDVELDEEGEVIPANYNVQITAARGFSEEEDQTPCFNGELVSIDFGGVAETVDPDNGEGEEIPPNVPPECLPGNDCTARWDREENTITYDSLFLLRHGWPESGPVNAWFSDTPIVNGTTEPSNAFRVENADRTEVLFDGSATSSLPTMDLQPSQMFAINADDFYTNIDLDSRIASHLNTGAYPYESNAMVWRKYLLPDNSEACNAKYFSAPQYKNTDWAHWNGRRYDITGSAWYTTYEVPDPRDPPEASKAVKSIPGARKKFEQRHVTWTSVFTGQCFSQSGVGSDDEPFHSPLNRMFDISVRAPRYVFAHNGEFSGNQFFPETYVVTDRIRVREDNIYHEGSQGFSKGSYLSAHGIPNRNGLGWWTCKIERYVRVEYKDNNDDGEFGAYQRGCVLYTLHHATWFFNGQQVTPRSLISQFLAPSSYNSSVPWEMQKDFISDDFDPRWFHLGDPHWRSAHVNADYITHPISVGSREDANYVDIRGQHLLTQCNQAEIIEVEAVGGGNPDVPVLAIVDHNEVGDGFFQSDQFKAMIKAFSNNTPDYCERIPSA